MAFGELPNSAAMQRQRLLIEFNGMKTASPQGVFVSLSPKDAAIWTGVIFVREGPYAGAILRFQISFPPAYPAMAPLVTFLTDIFHPLVAPLTVQLYTSTEDDSTGIVILDDERLPPGGFSLRHGFPSWFKRTRRNASSSQGSSTLPTATAPNPATPTKQPHSRETSTLSPTSTTLSPGSNASRDMADPEEGVTIFEVLRYIRSSFDDATVLDEVQLEAAGNSGAWRAWKAHRAQETQAAALRRGQKLANTGVSKSAALRTARQPGEWNWDGVWQVRAKRGIELSVSEAALYGNSPSNDELINFLQADEDIIEVLKENMRLSLRRP